MSSSEDPLNLTNEIITILASNDNKESLEKSEKFLIEKARLFEEQEISVQEAIRELTKRGKQAALVLDDTHPDNAARIAELKQENTVTGERIENIEQDICLLEKAYQEKDLKGEYKYLVSLFSCFILVILVYPHGQLNYIKYKFLLAIDSLVDYKMLCDQSNVASYHV